MSPEKAVFYINSVVLSHQERASIFEFCDQLLPKSYPTEVMPWLRIGSKNNLFYEVRTTLIESDLHSLATAGVKVIQPGVEALSTRVLKLMAKGTTSNHNIAHLKQCAHHGIMPVWTFLVGLPGEDAEYYEQYKRLIPHITHLPPPMGISPVGFHRNSPYTWYPSKYNLMLTPAKAYRYIYKLAEDEVKQLAYYFDDLNDQADYKENVKKYGDELFHRVQVWRSAWFNSNIIPQLYFMRDLEGHCIYDSRSSIVKMHRLDSFERDLLERFSAPQLVKTIAEAVDSPQRFAAAKKNLLRLGLLFVDEGRGISLVLKHQTAEPAALSSIKQEEAKLH
jgi:magnesium-protoporphyrin IX monomethyl ester (oxidative) cyclase